MFIPLDSIDVGSRIREDMGGDDFEEFVKSFPKYGQLQPIVVKTNGGDRYELVAGERRLRALKQLSDAGVSVPALPPGQIEAVLRENLPKHTRLLMEFAENKERKDFTYVEKAKFIRNFHETMQAAKGADVWTQELTAVTLNLSTASISHYLRVEQAIKDDPAVAKAATLDAAVKRMKVTERLKLRHDAVRKDDNNNALQRASNILSLGDAREWIKTLEDESVDLVNFDPPWGNNTSHKAAENHEEFDDTTEYSDELMSALFPEIFRILKNDRFCIFWHRAWSSETMASFAESFGFNLQFTRTPCIWYKPDKTADQNRVPEKQLIDAYESFFLLRKGDPLFHERMSNNVFAHSRVPLGSIIHPTEKPLSLCAEIVKLTSVPGELIVDPTAGSSAFLDAALRNSRKAKGCEKSERYHERGIGRIGDYLKTFSEK